MFLTDFESIVDQLSDWQFHRMNKRKQKNVKNTNIILLFSAKNII